MGNIMDYISWRGDLSFAQSPFNEVDNLILACFSYVNLDGIPAASGQKGIELKKLVKEFKIESYLRQRFSNLSGGQKQKLFLVSALQNSPEYFFLDEITTGLDSESRGELFKFLSSNLKVKNSTLLLVTHYLEEALQLCDRFIILKDGKIIADLQKSDLIQEEFSFVEFLAEQAIIKFNKELVLYQKTYRINLEELLS